jgi:hypothetical protein
MTALYFFCFQIAFAAQNARVISDQAEVLEQPQSKARVIVTLKKNAALIVSNLPTENFYKTRLSDGSFGWLSGDQIKTESAGNQQIERGFELEGKNDPLDPRPRDEKQLWWSHARVLLGYGLQNLSLDPLAGLLRGVDQVRLTNAVSAELQFQIWEFLAWATRVEYRFSSASGVVLDDGSTREVKYSAVPLSVGLIVSPLEWGVVRVGAGIYAGLAIGNRLDITDSLNGNVARLSYSSTNPMFQGLVQASVGLSRRWGLLVEGGYTIQKATYPASTAFNLPQVDVNFGGFVSRLGIEFRFD